MKFQLKALAAAFIMSAATLPAQAAISTASSGDSSMVLTLVDFADGISSVFNLGYTYSQFSTLVSAAESNGGAVTWDVASLYGSTWSSFWSTAQAGNTSWAVYAGDGTGNGVGARGFLTTRANVASTSNTNLQLTTQLNATVTNFDTYLSANEATDSSVATAGAPYAGSAKAYGSTGRVNASGFDATNPLNTSMNVFQLQSGATNTSPISITTLGNSNGNYSFALSSAGVLTFSVPTVTPVPEADTYALMFAGLAVVGAVVRRRKA